MVLGSEDEGVSLQSFGKQEITLLYQDKSQVLTFYSVISYASLRRTARSVFDIPG